MIALGWVTVIALPLAVLTWAMFWPQPIPPERSVEGIRRRIEAEDAMQPVRNPQRRTGRIP
ncbi:hypothetical protein [Nocardia vermiculata]|uniref:Uncharacterized protein n=1 Tax=Nocardia vermiculata TaxID=257274 RepID=A0A846Y0U2_9NOCA|nr:hypothetical protein [Nocardia vermiculata]NKY50179.1 hypothetical protein [Nocardia vermiculata]